MATSQADVPTPPQGPTKFGVLLYPGFEVLDVFGPLEALNVISRTEFEYLETPPLDCIKDIELYVITTGKTVEAITAVAPVKEASSEETSSPEQRAPSSEQKALSSEQMPPKPEVKSLAESRQLGSAAWPRFEPNCTMHCVPPDMEVLIIPGGLGSSAVGEDVIEWIRKTLPNLKYLFTVCTGSLIAARAGVLDGMKATTNKQAWNSLTDLKTLDKNPKWKNVHWVANARWVKSSDQIWTTSGVSAGTDGFIAWMKEVYGQAYGEKVCQWMEYRAVVKATPDHFAVGLHDVIDGKKVC